jgi:hypothetical protein
MHPSHSPRANSSRPEPAHLATSTDQPESGTRAAAPGRRGLRTVALDPAASDSPLDDNGPAGARLPAARPSWARPAHTAEERPFPAPALVDEPYEAAEPVALADEAYPDADGRHTPERAAAPPEPIAPAQSTTGHDPSPRYEPSLRPDPADPAPAAARHESPTGARTVSRDGWLEEPALGEHAVDDLDDRAEVSTAALAGTERPDDATRIDRPGESGPSFGAEQPGGVDEPVAAVAGRRPGDVAASTTTLWSEDSARRLRAEWQEVAARFIDEPQEALDAAQVLVTRAVRELADALLAEQGETDPRRLVAQPDTEAMRMAMRGYREFLDRLLAL